MPKQELTVDDALHRRRVAIANGNHEEAERIKQAIEEQTGEQVVDYPQESTLVKQEVHSNTEEVSNG